MNPSPRIGPVLADTLGTLPGFTSHSNLAVRNLIRGHSLGLPCGQHVASALGYVPLSSVDIASGSDGAVAAGLGLLAETPLWYYILKEAEIQAGGRTLGQVGSRIVAEVILGLLEFASCPLVRPGAQLHSEFPAADPGRFTMPDLLRFADCVNPLGEVAGAPAP